VLYSLQDSCEGASRAAGNWDWRSCINKEAAFIPERTISNNILIVQELVHSMEMDSKQDGIMIAKLEMGSAYDRLDWGFLEKVLTSLGFTERWIGGLDDVFVIQSLQYLWTALPPLVQVHDGTASGLCLLLIFLFYVLRCFLIYWDWRWKMAWSRDWTLIDDPLECAIYFFADDFLLFSRVTIAECDSVMAIVMHYSSLSGQKINISKSSLATSTSIGAGRR